MDGVLLAVGDGGDAARIDAARHEKALHRVRPARPEGEIVLARAALVAVALDADADPRIAAEPFCLLGEDGFAVGLHRVLVGVEVDPIAHIDDEILL
jgi:hypothetical protein